MRPPSHRAMRARSRSTCRSSAPAATWPGCWCAAGALRGLSLVELLHMNVTALQTLLPRVTEPMLHKAEVLQLDPADLVTLGTEVASFGAEGAEGAIPERVEDAMADLAMVFHWRPADMEDMSLAELGQWHERARERYESQD